MLREQRKRDHVHYALTEKFEQSAGFEDIHFVHQSLPNTSLFTCSLQTEVGGLKLSSPFLVNAMTGGAPEIVEINRELARAASGFGMPMAVGSQRNALLDPKLAYSYQVVREENPHGLVFANLGAGATLEDSERAVSMLKADALQLHLNVPQELAMPEGDRDFCGILDQIRLVTEQLQVPVIVKEVGFGMSTETVQLLKEAGVKVIDVSGKGGTNFVQIENRRSDRPFDHLESWGQSTVISLLEASAVTNGPDLIGSGGVQSPLDAAKCLALGACAVGASGYWLRIWKKAGYEGLIDEMQLWHDRLKLILTLLGCNQPSDLKKVPLVISGFTAEWCQARGIAISEYGRRSLRP